MTTPSPLLLRIAPVIFVMLWSTGWIVARAITPYADPLTYLTARFAMATVVLFALGAVTGARWPTSFREVGHMMFSGALAIGVYFSGVWYAIGHGVPAGVSGLIAALQPLLTALLAPIFLKEKISGLQWLGIVLSSAGIALVLEPKLATVAPADLNQLWGALTFNALGMLAFTIASIHQKKYLAHCDLWALTPIQMLSGLLVIAPFAFLTEPMRLEWNAVTIGVMVWSVLVLSVGAGALYVTMIRAGAVSKVAALIYLVPLTVAVEAFFLFGETMTWMQIAGMLITSAGVALAMKRAA